MNLDKHSKIQGIAKQVLYDLATEICASSSEESIAERAKELLAEHGVKETWYYDVPAFVLLGSRSCISISGKYYIPATEQVGKTNLVTVDLSPCVDNIWGDCARSFVIENGTVVNNPEIKIFAEGLKTERYLHNEIKKYVSPETTFSDFFIFGNKLITELGWENLDFLKNLGHSIESNPDDRRFIDSECIEKIGVVSYFTFEPHIRKKGHLWGFKHENIYYFDAEGKIQEL
ncbi:MAG: M24 family metallopeptidase [Methylococcales bacterium]|nr:M24 family metallopeptidase [Methylococcales bacterium]